MRSRPAQSNEADHVLGRVLLAGLACVLAVCAGLAAIGVLHPIGVGP